MSATGGGGFSASPPPTVAVRALLQALALDAGLAAAAVFLFAVLRGPLPHLFATRWHSHNAPHAPPSPRRGGSTAASLAHGLDYTECTRDQTACLGLLPPPPSSLLHLIAVIVSLPDDVYLASCGLDAYVLTAVCGLGAAWFTLAVAPPVLAILLPLALLSTPPAPLDSDLDAVSIAALPQGSPWLWAHAAHVWWCSAALCLLIDRCYRRILPLRYSMLAAPHAARYSVLALDLPAYVCDDAALAAFMGKLYPGQVDTVCMVTRGAAEVADAADARNATVWALRALRATHERRT